MTVEAPHAVAYAVARVVASAPAWVAVRAAGRRSGARGHLRRPRAIDDGGSITAEFAVVLPSVVLVLGLALFAFSAGSGQFALNAAAGTLARSLVTGQSEAEVRAQAQKLGSVTVAVHDEGRLRCLSLERPLRFVVFDVAAVRLKAESCSLAR